MKVYCFEPGITKRLGHKPSEDCTMTLRAQMGDNQVAVAYNEEINMEENNKPIITSTVRRLMPIETERLMGFPDNHTRIKWDGNEEEDCPDTPRYKCCGNSMCVNCMEWIGRRISIVEALIREEKKNVECSKFNN